MLNRAKQQGPKTFCAIFQVAWDSTWLGCEGMKKTRHTYSEDGTQWPVLALLEGTRYTTQSLVVFIMCSTEGVCTLGGWQGGFCQFLVDLGYRVLDITVSMSTMHIHPEFHPPFLHSLKASLVSLSTARTICIPFGPRLEREQRCLVYFYQ